MEDCKQRQRTPEEEWRIRDAALDRTIEGTFPASDPLSSDPNPADPTALDRTTERPSERQDSRTTAETDAAEDALNVSDSPQRFRQARASRAR